MLHNSIPVAMYHHVSPAGGSVNVYPEFFEDQLSVLYSKGWKTLSGDEFLYFLQDKKDKPKKCVLLTFDDGFADNYVYAFPILKKHRMKAVLFVATDFIADAEVRRDPFTPFSHDDAWKLVNTERRSEAMCTWKELEEMESSGAVDVQSHGMSHNTPALFKRKEYAEIKRDLKGCKDLLEKRLSKKILHFAWPRGLYDEEGIRIAGEIGYEVLYTTDRGANSSGNLNAIRRLPVKCKKGGWLAGKLPIYSSETLSKIYLTMRAG